MYIKKLYDENIGPIQKAAVNMPFDKNELPKPVVFVGENGSGKSTLLSNIVDAFYTMANNHFDNAMEKAAYGDGQQYFKSITPSEIKIGNSYMCSYIEFRDSEPIHYIFKAGKFSVADLKTKTRIENSFNLNWETEGNFKQVQDTNKILEKVFKENVICYFGPDRYEKPLWMGNKYFTYENNLHPSVNKTWTRVLKNPITVRNVLDQNLQWLLDVIVDSRLSIEVKDGQWAPNHHQNLKALPFFERARKNLELIMSRIFGRDICFTLNYRSSGATRFRIVDEKTNEVISPTLDSLSTGQIALFNLFSTIVRYADNNNVKNSVLLNEIQGIVVIDEIELHLHTTLQRNVLPELIKLFPKIQFVITTHSPLFLLGMDKVLGANNYAIYEMPNANQIDVERFSEFQKAYDYFKETEKYQKDIQEAIYNIDVPTKVLVVTEGSTDWKHIKTAYSVLSQDPKYTDIFENLRFDFLEYESGNNTEETKLTLEMGNKRLCEVCENLAMLPQDKKYIFIADRDDKETNKKLEVSGRQYKSWGNNVFSFIIPTPGFRNDTPNICIEHLYTDEEIKTEVDCNGIKRRLFIGNEFDERGIAYHLDRFCEKAKLCGPESISIIEGSKGEKVTSLQNNDGVDNYALSKTNFAKFVAEHPDRFKFDNFLEIFNIIKAITLEPVN